MAKVTFGAFINSVSGRVGDIIYSTNQGGAYTKAYQPNVANPNSQRQQQCRAAFAVLSAEYSDLPEVNKLLWNGFASLSGKTVTGRGAFIKQNQQLLAASHAALVTIATPPKIPATPKFPKSFKVFKMSNNVNCITWTGPNLTDVFVRGYFRLHRGFCLHHPDYGLCTTVGYRPSFRQVHTVCTTVGSMLHVHNWPEGTRLFYKVDSIDTWGRLSPWSTQILITS